MPCLCCSLIYSYYESLLRSDLLQKSKTLKQLLCTENFGEIFYLMDFNPLCYKNTLYNGLKPIGLCAFISVLILNTTSPKFSVFHRYKSYKNEKTPVHVKCTDVFCDRAGARTRDPLIKSQMLYQLSYQINLVVSSFLNYGAKIQLFFISPNLF